MFDVSCIVHVYQELWVLLAVDHLSFISFPYGKTLVLFLFLKARLDKLLKWNQAVRILHILVNLIKVRVIPYLFISIGICFFFSPNRLLMILCIF